MGWPLHWSACGRTPPSALGLRELPTFAVGVGVWEVGVWTYGGLGRVHVFILVTLPRCPALCAQQTPLSTSPDTACPPLTLPLSVYTMCLSACSSTHFVGPFLASYAGLPSLLDLLLLRLVGHTPGASAPCLRWGRGWAVSQCLTCALGGHGRGLPPSLARPQGLVLLLESLPRPKPICMYNAHGKGRTQMMFEVGCGN